MAPSQAAPKPQETFRPRDIALKTFPAKSRRGYEPAEVDAYLMAVARHVESMNYKLEEMSEELVRQSMVQRFQAEQLRHVTSAPLADTFGRSNAPNVEETEHTVVAEPEVATPAAATPPPPPPPPAPVPPPPPPAPVPPAAAPVASASAEPLPTMVIRRPDAGAPPQVAPIASEPSTAPAPPSPPPGPVSLADLPTSADADIDLRVAERSDPTLPPPPAAPVTPIAIEDLPTVVVIPPIVDLTDVAAQTPEKPAATDEPVSTEPTLETDVEPDEAAPETTEGVNGTHASAADAPSLFHRADPQPDDGGAEEPLSTRAWEESLALTLKAAQKTADRILRDARRQAREAEGERPRVVYERASGSAAALPAEQRDSGNTVIIIRQGSATLHLEVRPGADNTPTLFVQER